MLLIQATTPVWRPTPWARPGRRSRCPASPWPPAWCPAPGEHPAQSTLSGEAVRAEGREARHSLWHCRWRVNSAFPVREHNIYYERVYEDKVLQKYMQTIISSTWLFSFHSCATREAAVGSRTARWPTAATWSVSGNSGMGRCVRWHSLCSGWSRSIISPAGGAAWRTCRGCWTRRSVQTVQYCMQS